MFQSLFRRSFKPSAPPPTSARLRPRLGCEMLEDRVVPAASVFVWLGEFAGGYDNSDNWVADGGTDHPLPVTGDTMIFGVGGGSFDCVIPEAFSFAAVWIIADYGSTVTLQDNTVIGRLEMHSQDGSIAQLGSSATGYDLFITDWLNFTNGTLNSSSNTGIVHLDSLTFGLSAPTTRS